MKNFTLITTILISALTTVEKPAQAILVVLFNRTGGPVKVGVTKIGESFDSDGIVRVGDWSKNFAEFRKDLNDNDYCWVDLGWYKLRIMINDQTLLGPDAPYKITDTICFDITKTTTKERSKKKNAPPVDRVTFGLSLKPCGHLSLDPSHLMKQT